MIPAADSDRLFTRVSGGRGRENDIERQDIALDPLYRN